MRAAMGIVLALMAAGALLQYATQTETRNLLGQRASLGELRPPAFRLAPLATTDEFLERAGATKVKVDRARTREPSGGLISEFENLD